MNSAGTCEQSKFFSYLVKGLVANGALEGFLSGVSESMVFVIALLMKSLPTVLAHPWSESLVDPHVSVECGTPVECLSTGATFMWLLVSMDDLMTTQSRRLAEAFPAHLTDKWASA